MVATLFLKLIDRKHGGFDEADAQEAKAGCSIAHQAEAPATLLLA